MDLIFSMFFYILKEALNKMMDIVVSRGYLKGLTCMAVLKYHLFFCLFANDNHPGVLQ